MFSLVFFILKVLFSIIFNEKMYKTEIKNYFYIVQKVNFCKLFTIMSFPLILLLSLRYDSILKIRACKLGFNEETWRISSANNTPKPQNSASSPTWIVFYSWTRHNPQGLEAAKHIWGQRRFQNRGLRIGHPKLVKLVLDIYNLNMPFLIQKVCFVTD